MRIMPVCFLMLILLPALVLGEPVSTPENGLDEPLEELPLDEDKIDSEILEEAKKRTKKIRETREKNNEFGDPCMLNPNLPVCR